jgi:ribonuclease VapC
MIALDTSALMAVVLYEPQARACAAALQADDRIIISAGTVAEALIVASGRNVSEQIEQLIGELELEVVPVTFDTARRMQLVYRHWGRGHHPASLNLGDCFAYDVAKEHACPLLYVGDDFAKTDIKSVL